MRTPTQTSNVGSPTLSPKLKEKILTNLLSEDGSGFPIDGSLDLICNLISTHPTIQGSLRREKRDIYLHPMAWAWLEILALHHGLSLSEYIEMPLRRLGEPSLEALTWLDNKKQSSGVIRSGYCPKWDELIHSSKRSPLA